MLSIASAPTKLQRKFRKKFALITQTMLHQTLNEIQRQASPFVCKICATFYLFFGQLLLNLNEAPSTRDVSSISLNFLIPPNLTRLNTSDRRQQSS